MPVVDNPSRRSAGACGSVVAPHPESASAPPARGPGCDRLTAARPCSSPILHSLNPPPAGHSPASIDQRAAMVEDLVVQVHTCTHMIGDDGELLPDCRLSLPRRDIEVTVLFRHGNEL